MQAQAWTLHIGVTPAGSSAPKRGVHLHPGIPWGQDVWLPREAPEPASSAGWHGTLPRTSPPHQHLPAPGRAGCGRAPSLLTHGAQPGEPHAWRGLERRELTTNEKRRRRRKRLQRPGTGSAAGGHSQRQCLSGREEDIP